MKYEFKFNRILTLKEREKDEVQFAYQESVGKFEKVAERLYELLKQKEDLEAYQAQRLAKGLPVNDVRHYQDFLDNLEKVIRRQQKIVINARNRMYLLQERLMEKNIEVKKFEKIRERDALHFYEKIKSEDNKNMDDISIQNYLNRGIR